ncbi:hypothetical protein FLB_14870 [Flavobacterium succinicans]|uniref:Uncharacterized protein n=1 Tax=Flavobacterium succinicans TaxID=29536 RepID=A0A199XS92_9FLAO|nr:hypothetical protein FLB_14870 [Flavobacterium succinicans]
MPAGVPAFTSTEPSLLKVNPVGTLIGVKLTRSYVVGVNTIPFNTSFINTLSIVFPVTLLIKCIPSFEAITSLITGIVIVAGAIAKAPLSSVAENRNVSFPEKAPLGS